MLSHPDRPTWLAPRRSEFSGLDEAELTEQLIALQAFHEIGHLIEEYEYHSSADRGLAELKCDEFAVSELEVMLGRMAYTEIVESRFIVPFLAVTLWTILDEFVRPSGPSFGRATFTLLRQRYRSMSMQLDRMNWQTVEASKKSHDELLEKLEVCEEILRILQVFFAKACLHNSSAFGFADQIDEVGERMTSHKQGLTAGTNAFLRDQNDRPEWRLILEAEDKDREIRYAQFSYDSRRTPRRRPLHTDL